MKFTNSFIKNEQTKFLSNLIAYNLLSDIDI